MNMMPNFFIVGAARSGTTSLDRYLSRHPEIYMAPRKEVNFFTADHFPCTGPGDERINREVIREKNQYARLFAGVVGEKAIGESSVFYLCFPGTAERIALAVPHAKILIVLRDPVDRAFSAYLHLVRNDREHLGFAEALNEEEERRHDGYEPLWWYKELSMYYKQVKQYVDVFGEEQVKVLFFDELFTHTEEVLRDIFLFLHVQEDAVIDTTIHYNYGGMPRYQKLFALLDKFIADPNFFEKCIKALIPSRLREVYAVKAMRMVLRPTPLDPTVSMELKEYFAEDIRQLEELLHRDLHHWKYRSSEQHVKITE